MNVQKRVVLSVNSDIGKFGSVGYRAEHIAAALDQIGALEKIIVRGAASTRIPSRYVQVVAPFFSTFSIAVAALRKVYGAKFGGYKFANYAFDVLALRCLTHTTNLEIFHCWENSQRCFQFAKRCGAKTILDVAMDLWDPKAISYVDYVIAPSMLLVEKAQELGFARENVFYNPFGVDTDFFVPHEQSTLSKQFMFSGVLNSRKGIDTLLEAWKIAGLRDFKLVLCGRKTQYFSRLSSQFGGMGVEARGFLAPHELRDEYQKSWGFLLPSRKEGSAKAVYEALACGVPVITTPEAGSVVTDGEDGFVVEQGNASELAARIKMLATDVTLRRRLALAARRKALDYSWDEYAKRTLQIYDRIETPKVGSPQT